MAFSPRPGQRLRAERWWKRWSGTRGRAGFSHVDYVAVRRADDLAAFEGGSVDAPGRILAAAWLGRTRLIDNMAVAAPA